MMLTVWKGGGIKKSIHLPVKALDEVKEMLYNNRDKIAGYSICISDYERKENVKFLEECIKRDR